MSSGPKRLARFFDLEDEFDLDESTALNSSKRHAPPITPEWIDEEPMPVRSASNTAGHASAASSSSSSSSSRTATEPPLEMMRTPTKGRRPVDEELEDATPVKRTQTDIRNERIQKAFGGASREALTSKRDCNDFVAPARKRQFLAPFDPSSPDIPKATSQAQATDREHAPAPPPIYQQAAERKAREDEAPLIAAAISSSMGQNLTGSSVSRPGTEEILFQVSRYLLAVERETPTSFKPAIGNYGQSVTPLCRLLGRTKDGRAVQLYVAGFRPYFYAHAPADLNEDDLVPLKTYLEKSTGARIRELKIVRDKFDMMGYSATPIRALRVELLVPGEVPRLRDHWFGANAPIRADMSSPVDPRVGGFTWSGMRFKPLVWEADVQFHQRLSLDVKGVPYSWIRLPANSFTLEVGSLWMKHCDVTALIHYRDMIVHEPVGEYAGNAPFVTCSVDIECLGRKGIFPDPQFDPISQIGCVVYEDVMGVKRADAVCFTTGTGGLLPKDEAFRVEKRTAEREILQCFSDYLVARRVDVLTGYNTDKFDMPYMMDRAVKNGIGVVFSLTNRSPYKAMRLVKNTFSSKAFGASDGKNLEADFESVDMLRWFQRNQKMRSYTLSNVSKEILKNDKKDMPHTLIVEHHYGTDAQQLLLWEYNIWDADLAQRLYFKMKVYVNMIETSRVAGVDLHTQIANGQQVRVHSQILRMCRDANFIVPTRPRERSAALDDDDDDAPVVHVSATQKKITRQLTAHHKKGVFSTPAAKVVKASKAAYAGATVIDPIKGFYDLPITTLDFSSLYPSIMIAHNLCYSAMVLDATLVCRCGHSMLHSQEVLACGCVEETPQGHRFVTDRVRQGILTRVLRNLLEARGLAKKDMAAAKASGDVMMAAVYDGKQLALKVMANSVYGFTGAIVGKLPCIPISAGVTSYGRDMLMLVKKNIELTYQGKVDGLGDLEFNAKVIYGDTDSVMVRSGCKTVAEGIAFGKHAAAYVNSIFTAFSILESERVAFVKSRLGDDYPHDIYKALSDNVGTLGAELRKAYPNCAISLLFEKVLFYTLFAEKKRYCGGFWTTPDKPDKIHIAGFSAVRRDNSPFESEVCNLAISKLMTIGMDPKVVFEMVFDRCQDLVRGNVDFDDLVITRAYSKEEGSYVGDTGKNMPHIIVNRRRRERGAEVYHMGDRIPYIMVRTEAAINAVKQSALKMKDTVEDIDYAREFKLTPDYAYYVRRLEKPLSQIFDIVFGEGFTEKNLFKKLRITAKPIENRIWNSFKNTKDAATGEAVAVPRRPLAAGPVPRTGQAPKIDVKQAVVDFKAKKVQSTLMSFAQAPRGRPAELEAKESPAKRQTVSVLDNE